MDDLKVVLYIVVAIIWVVYNNYKKITEASKKRDFTKPPAEVIQENWPGKSEKPIRRETRVPKEIVEKQTSKEVRKVLERKPLPPRTLVRRQPSTARQRSAVPFDFGLEGGTSTPSKLVHFEEQTLTTDEPNALLTAIRNMDMRQGIVLAEILKRPYN